MPWKGVSAMKVAIASDDKINISHHFGRAVGFVVFDIAVGKVVGEEYRENRGKSNGECGSCDHATMINNIKDCSVVISYGMGQRIYQDLLDCNIKGVVTEEHTVNSAIAKFMDESLKNRLDKLH
jgi:predicted Fe-Mo cluster-binding NifX family protein